MFTFTGSLVHITPVADKSGNIRQRGSFTYFDNESIKAIDFKFPDGFSPEKIKMFLNKKLSFAVSRWESGQNSGFYIPKDSEIKVIPNA